MQERQSLGRIEVAPEVLVTIAQFATLRVEGVVKLVPAPADMGRLFRRDNRHGHDGVSLDLTNDKVKFDIYVVMTPHVNLMETSRTVQTAIAEAIDTMVGVSVDSVNVHVEDVIYAQGEAV